MRPDLYGICDIGLCSVCYELFLPLFSVRLYPRVLFFILFLSLFFPYTFIPRVMSFFFLVCIRSGLRLLIIRTIDLARVYQNVSRPLPFTCMIIWHIFYGIF